MKAFIATTLMLSGGLLIGSPLVAAQVTADATDVIAAEQNETFRDTLVRMRIKREEEEHKKIVAKAERLKDLTQELLNAAANDFLPRTTDKQLKEVEKNARSIRSESGGGNDVTLEQPPTDLAATLKQLNTISESINKKLAKTSRHIVSITVAAEASEIIQLVKLLRGYLR